MLIKDKNDLREFFRRLNELGGEPYTEEDSLQTCFTLSDGSILTFGWCDRELTQEQNLWFMIYDPNRRQYREYT